MAIESEIKKGFLGLKGKEPTQTGKTNELITTFKNYMPQ
jgi:hypothetical protein